MKKKFIPITLAIIVITATGTVWGNFFCTSHGVSPELLTQAKKKEKGGQVFA